MTCTHRLHDADGLLCTRADAHDPLAPGGHTYTGSSAPDGHDDSERRAEETRG